MRNLCFLLAVLCIVFYTATAQNLPFTLQLSIDGVTHYTEHIPKPEDALGYKIGEKHTYPHLIVEYFYHVAEASDRVIVGTHGKTYDHRLLIHAIVTSPDNHLRLEEIRQNNLRVSRDPRQVTDSELDAMPTVIWMGYGVHGNEASSFEAAMLLLYHLSAGEGENIENLLENTVILLIPSLNPDGHHRFVHWVNSNRGKIPTTDPHHREQNEPWPSGRTNYYWFDLNRDWLLLQHPESQGRMRLYNQWRPQLVTDFHEFGSDQTYFFQPGVSSRYNPNIPQNSIQLLKEIGTYHSRILDNHGVLYYSHETFDDFYIGKGSTYPMVTGAIGILFEQAASRALKRETIHGVLEFSHTIRNQFLTSISTLNAALDLRVELLRNQRNFYRESEEIARQNPIKAFIISLKEDRSRAQALLQILHQHRVRIYQLRDAMTLNGYQYQPESAVIIPVNQPESRFLSAAMEKYKTFEDSLFYDVSSWTLPLAFHLQYGEYRRDPSRLIGNQLESTDFDGGELIGRQAQYAYILDWQSYFAPRALYRFQRKGLNTYVITQPVEFELEGNIYKLDRGAVVIPLTQPEVEPNIVHKIAREAVTEDYVTIYSVASGTMVSGPDLGSPSVRMLTQPRIAVLSGRGIWFTEVGEVWHLLNERMHIPISLIDIDLVERTDLERYTTLIMVHGSYDRFSKPAIEKLNQWVNDGGILVTSRNASRWVIQSGMVPASIIDDEEDYSFVVEYENISVVRDAQQIAGAIFESEFDITHPICFGVQAKAPVFRNHTIFYEPVNKPGVTIGRYTDTPLLSGYISDRRENQLKGTASLSVFRKERGVIILFADNPNFRAFWYGTNRLFLNSIFFGNILLREQMR